MSSAKVQDLDYLAARLHGRRSRLAEGERLAALSRVPDLPAFRHAVYPDAEFHATADFQRRLTQDLVREICGFLRHLEGTGGDLLAWMLVRFQVENVKVLLRRITHATPLKTPEEFLLSLPHDLALNVAALLAAKSLEEFAEQLPSGPPRTSLRKALQFYHDQRGSFFLEAALDHGYDQELLARTERLSDEDKDLVKPITLQEVGAFHLMLATRARFHHGLSPALISPLHVRWAGISGERFEAMLAAPDISSAARFAVGRAIDSLPGERAAGDGAAPEYFVMLEALTWKRFLRLSNRAFRRSQSGLGTVFGYVGIRRVEVANLITLSEAFRIGVAAEAICRRLIPRTDLEGVYV
jgi:vacuolar-type H+-ATPase subunit C/Vma6